jgi:YegS/Rv2252/BmrU family lipid kinase
VLAEILAVFNRADFDLRVYVTAEQGDGVGAVAKLAPGMDLVVCCGGDGTFNETITGLLLAELEIPVGYIPAGSTNDFAASLNLSSDCVEAAKAIVAGTANAYDVGSFGDRYFSYVASFGAFTKASYAVPQSIKNALGHTAYVLGGISELSQIRNEHIRMEIDGEVVEDDFLFGAICNATSIGGIINLKSNQIDMGDGKFEILLIRAARSLNEIGECIQAVQTQKYDCGMITFRSARKIRIFADPNMAWTLDGEREDGHAEVLVENIHRAIRIVKRVENND